MAKLMRKKVLGQPSSYARVQVERFKVADLQPAPYNARQITDVALQGLVASMERFGVLALPVVNRRKDGTLRLIGGHQRVKGLQQEGAQEVDCVVVSIDDEHERRANFVLNNPHIEGTFVPELTRDLIRQLDEAYGATTPKLLSDLRLDVLLKDVMRAVGTTAGVDDVETTGKSLDDEVVNLGKSVSDSKPGAFYQLGLHRLYCGKLAEIGTLDGFEVEAADMAFSRFAAPSEYGDKYLGLYLGHLLANTDGGIYVATSTARLAQVQRTFEAAGGHWSNTLVCFEPTAKGKADQPFRDVSIPIVYGWREGVMRMFYGDRTQANCWHLKKTPPKDDVPVEAIVRHMFNSSKKGGVVLDVTADRGTTVIAAEKTGRRCIGYVASPRDMDRVRARWTRFVFGPDKNWKTVTNRVE